MGDNSGRPPDRRAGADDIGCQEWVISRLSANPGFRLAADGANLAFALAGPTRSVGALTGAYRSRDLYSLAGTINAITADGDNTAVLSNGRVDVRTRLGRSLVALETPNATSLSMRGDTIAATTRSGMAAACTAKARACAWRLPRGTAPRVDLHFRNRGRNGRQRGLRGERRYRPHRPASPRPRRRRALRSRRSESYSLRQGCASHPDEPG